MPDKNRRTFLQNVAAASMFSLTDLNAQGNTQPTGRPPIQFDFATSLDKDDIYRFLDSAAPTWPVPPSPAPTTWPVPATIDAKYSLSNAPAKSVGSISTYPDTSSLHGKAIRLWWATQKRCRVFEGAKNGQLVGTPKVVIPKSYQVTIQFFAVLLIKNDGSVAPPVKAKIETAFSNFQYPRDGDPLSFIQTAIGHDPTIKTDYFSVVIAFSISKVPGSLLVNDDLDSDAKRLYAGQTPGTVRTNPNPNSQQRLDGPNGFFAQRNMQLVCPENTEYLGRVPVPQQDPHEVELPPGYTEDKAKTAVQQIAKNDTPGQCGELTENDWPILTLAEWPEFKVDWRDFAFEIGCGIRIVLTLPVLQIQISGVDLWVYTKYPSGLSVVLKIIEQCAFEAALSGAVVGVVLLDPVAGIAAFEAYFEGCIINHLEQTIECMVPGLGLITSVKNAWHDVI